MTSPSKNIPNMDEIMDAIQKVLEEHDVGQARVVLELFDEVDRQKGLSVEDGGHDDYYNNQPYHQQQQQQQLVNLEGIQGDGPIMKSPKPQPPPPRPVSHSDRRTHMANAGGAGPAVSTKPQWLNNLQPLSPTGETKKTTTTAAAAPHAPNTMTFGSTDARRPDEDLDSTVKELASTSRPDTQQTSPSKAAAPAPRSSAAPTLSPRPPAKKASASPAVASTPISNSNITPTRSAADERRRSLSKLNTTPDMNATPPELSPEAQLGQMAMGGFNPAEMLPEEMFRTLAKQQDRNERVRILKSFVGKSVLLDDKKMREQTTANPPAKMFLTDITRGNPPTSVPPPSSKALPNLPRSATTTTTTTPRKAGEGSARTPTTAAARGGALASNKATRDSGSSDSQDSTLPRINSRGAITSNVGKTVHTPGIHTAQTFTDTCRDNAKRAAKMNVGLTNTLLDRQSPTTSPRAGGNRGGGGGGGKSLQEMLQEQEELDRQNQAGLEKHTKIMSEARKFLARVEDNDDVRPHLEVLRAQRALDGPSQIRSPRATSAATTSTSTANNNNNTASRPNTNTTTATTTTKSSAPNWTNRTTTMTTTTTTTTATSGSNANGSIRPMNGSNNNTTKTTTTSVTSSTGSAPGITPGTSAQPPQHLSIHPQPPVSPTRTATGSRRDSNSPRQSTIQVVRFTMPQEPQAKREVMEQLQRSSAGQQHVSSKDRFSTLLAEQQRQLDAHQATDADYQKLIQKAEEYNKSLNA